MQADIKQNDNNYIYFNFVLCFGKTAFFRAILLTIMSMNLKHANDMFPVTLEDNIVHQQMKYMVENC